MGSEQWDHASLAAAFTTPARAPSKRPAGDAASAWWGDWGGVPGGGAGAADREADSPLDGWELEMIERRAFRQLGHSVRQSGWLLKAYGEGPQRTWRSRFLFLTADRLCYTADPEADGVRYLPLDRIPVRALPRGYGPKLGVALVEDRQVDRSHPQLSPKKAGCVFSVACGSHTHFLAAPSPGEARAWVDAITAAWLQCVKHTERGTHSPTAEEALLLREARWRAHSQTLRRSAAEAELQRLRESTAAWQAAASAESTLQPVGDQVVCYDIEVVTGSHPEAGTTSRVYLELCGEGGSTGEHRLMYREGSTRVAFASGATDAFKMHCRPLGGLLKARVYHSNAGPHPAWLLEEVRVREQDAPTWTVFPCRRWLAVHQDDGRVMRELLTASTQTAASLPAPQLPPPRFPSPPPPATADAVPEAAQQEEEQQPVAAERVVQPVWYTVAVCTADQEGAELAPGGAEGGAPPAVFLVLQGSRGSSQRVKLPSQAGDFQKGQDDVFRVQLPCVGTLERLTVGLSGAGKQASWLVEQVEVTDEGSGDTAFFPCSAWLGGAKGPTERTLLASKSNPREAQRELAQLRQQAEAAKRQLAEAQAELAAARAAASGAEEASLAQQAELEGRLAALQAEAAQVKGVLTEAQEGSAQAQAQVDQLRSQLAQAEQRAGGLAREQEAGRQREGSEASRAGQLAAQVEALHDELAEAQEAAAAAAARARKCEGEARRAEEALDGLRGQHERHKRDSSVSVTDAEGELRRLRAEVAAKAAEVQEAKQAEAEYAAECEQLSRDLAAERIRAKERVEEAERQAAAAQQAAAAAATSQPSTPASAKRSATYRVCVHTSAEPASAGTCCPVWLELVGSLGSTGAVALDRKGSAACFAPGASDVFRLEVPDVGEVQQLNVWVEAEDGEVAPGEAPASPPPASGSDDASWHLDCVEVAVQGVGAPPPSYFLCRKWLDARNGYRAELPASAKNPRLEETEYKVVVFTSSVAGCGTAGNVCVDLQGDKGASGVLTLRNKGGSFRPGQADAFTFRLPGLGALSELRVGHDGRREWHLERVEVSDPATGTTYFFPCSRWVPPGAMSRALQLRGYTTDPGSLPVRYRVELAVESVEGAAVPPDGLRLVLLGARGESGAQAVDASRATAGRPLVGWFDADNVGPMERLRIGLAPTPEGQHSALLVGRVTVTNMPSGECATFHCSEWLRSSDPFDLELDTEGEAGQEQEEEACVYRVEVQTSDVRKAGTAGSVFLTVVGEVCTIGPYQLSNTEAEHFQRGQLDVFEIDGAPDCGRLRQIEVRHDGQGRGSGWHLSWVKVSNLTTSAVAMFKCNRWVDKRHHTDPGVVGVVAALPPEQAAAAAGRQRSAKDRVLLGTRGSLGGSCAGGGPTGPAAVAAAAAAKVAMVQDRRVEMDLGAVVETAAGQPAGPPGYRIAFHTSRICGSGTRAKVHFELSGAAGSSGVLHPVGTSKSFGAGRLDVFDYPHLPFLGELQSARVGTNGTGLFPAWHLSMLVVTHLPTGRVWQFSCYNWIDKRCNHNRWLQLDSIVHGTSKPQVAGGQAGGWHAAVQKPASSSSLHGSPGSSPAYMAGQRYGGASASASPTRFAAQQHVGSPAGTPVAHSKVNIVSGRPGSPVRGGGWGQQQGWGGQQARQQQGWQQQQQVQQYGLQQRGSPGHTLYSAGSGVPTSPRIAAARPRSSGRFYGAD